MINLFDIVNFYKIPIFIRNDYLVFYLHSSIHEIKSFLIIKLFNSVKVMYQVECFHSNSILGIPPFLMFL